MEILAQLQAPVVAVVGAPRMYAFSCHHRGLALAAIAEWALEAGQAAQRRLLAGRIFEKAAQDFGPKANFKKQQVKIPETWKGFPSWSQQLLSNLLCSPSASAPRSRDECGRSWVP